MAAQESSLKAVTAVAGVFLLFACATAAAPRSGVPDVAADSIYFWHRPTIPLGQPDVSLLVNREGTPRIAQPDLYRQFMAGPAREVARWAADPRINLSPNFVVALIAKESGFEAWATSHVPANGLTQITHIADLDLQIISREAPQFQWMRDEVGRWPRSAIVHRENAAKAVTDSLLSAGVLKEQNEYLFDPYLSVRAGMFWLRVLATVWLEDEWPGANGTFAREKLNGGKPLTEEQLLELVTVSYNQGHPYVRALIETHGRAWTQHLNEESSDYLERIKRYTLLFQLAPRKATSR